MRIEKGVFLYGSEEVSSLLAWGYYINDCKFRYKSIKRFLPYSISKYSGGYWVLYLPTNLPILWILFNFSYLWISCYHFENGCRTTRAGKQKEAEEIICVSFWFLLGIGFIGFFTLFFGAETIAVAMGDIHLDKLLRVISFSFLLMPFLSVARGYFQGFNNMMPTAVSQVIEQTIRVSIIVFLSLFLIAHGFDLYTVGAGAMLGSIAGGLIGIIVLILYMRQDFRSIFFKSAARIKGKRKIVKILFWQGLAICVSNLVLIFIQMADSVSFYSLLIGAGEQAENAKVLKGVYDRSIPLMQLGTVVTTSFSLSLIPIITAAKEEEIFPLFKKR